MPQYDVTIDCSGVGETAPTLPERAGTLRLSRRGADLRVQSLVTAASDSEADHALRREFARLLRVFGTDSSSITELLVEVCLRHQ